MTATGIDLASAAQHEAGHSVARWVLGLPFLRVTLNGPRGIPVVLPLPGQTILSSPSMLIALCGAIADYQRKGLTIKGSQIKVIIFGGSDTFELDDPATGEVAARPARLPAVAPGADLEYMAHRAARDGWPLVQCIAMWRDAERFMQELRSAVDAVAGPLLEKGELTYGDVAELAAAAMSREPSPVIPRWAA